MEQQTNPTTEPTNNESDTPLTEHWKQLGEDPWECCRKMEKRYSRASQNVSILMVELESLLDANPRYPSLYSRLIKDARQTLEKIYDNSNR